MLILLLFLFHFSHAQQIIFLKTLKGENVENRIEAGYFYSLYASAQMDRDELLAQIYVKTDDNRNTSLEAMKNSKENESSGLLTPFRVTSGARLISPLSDTLIKSLTGFLYVTTAEQSKDPHFHVYDVDRFQIIETKENRNSTLVFLNSKPPFHSSTITNWKQGNESSVELFRGFPGSWDVFNGAVFSNPVQWNEKFILIPNVEKFSVTLPIFYFQIRNDVFFHIRPETFDMNGYSTTDYTTTGFYMKSRNEEAQNVTINCKASEGETGAIIKPFMPDERGKVILETELITSPTGTPNITYQIRLPRIDPHMSISSVNSENGEFYIQYFFLAERRFSN